MANPRPGEQASDPSLANYAERSPSAAGPLEEGRGTAGVDHRHEQIHLLRDTLQANWSLDEGLAVGAGMVVSTSESPTVESRLSPDVFAVIGRPSGPRRAWVASDEAGHLPDVVIEMLSPSSEATARGEKMRIYRDVWEVRRYYLFDPIAELLEGYARGDGHSWRQIQPDARGCLECTPLGLRLGLRETGAGAQRRRMLRWVEPSGRVLPTEEEKADDDRRAGARRATADRDRAERERQRAGAADQRAEAAGQRAEAVDQRAVAQKQREEAEQQRADARRQRATVANPREGAAALRAETEKMRAQAARQRADAADQRADAADQRADAANLRADAADQRAGAADDRAEAEKQRAEDERQRADALARRLAELENPHQP